MKTLQESVKEWLTSNGVEIVDTGGYERTRKTVSLDALVKLVDAFMQKKD